MGLLNITIATGVPLLSHCVAICADYRESYLLYGASFFFYSWNLKPDGKKNPIGRLSERDTILNQGAEHRLQTRWLCGQRSPGWSLC